MVRTAPRAERADARAVEARSQPADEHHAGPRLGEDADAGRAHPGLDADEGLGLLADLSVAEVRFGEEAHLGVEREVLVEVVAEACAESVHGLAGALKTDAGVERADFKLVLVVVGLRARLRARRGGREE